VWEKGKLAERQIVTQVTTSTVIVSVLSPRFVAPMPQAGDGVLFFKGAMMLVAGLQAATSRLGALRFGVVLGFSMMLGAVPPIFPEFFSPLAPLVG
jgi:hypothetical protein